MFAEIPHILTGSSGMEDLCSTIGGTFHKKREIDFANRLC